MTQIRLGDLLIKAGVVNDAQLNAALNEQRQWGGRVGAILVRMGALSEDLLVKALSRQLNIPRAQIGPSDPINVPQQILERIDRNICESGLLLPVAYIQERRTLQVAVADPFNVVALDDLSRRVGLRIEPLIAGETLVLQAISRVFSGGGSIDSSISGTEPGMGFTNNAGNRMGQVTFAPPAPAPAPTTATTAPPFMAPPGMSPSMSMPPGTGSMSSPRPVGQEELRMLAEQQLRAVRALVELLLERGVFTQAQLQAWMSR